jgi:hypothetical protein
MVIVIVSRNKKVKEINPWLFGHLKWLWPTNILKMDRLKIK